MPVRPGMTTARFATLSVVNPSGHRSRVPVTPLPFLIGRNGDNNLVLRDNRISRAHAQITSEGSGYAIEDLRSRHGLFINGQRIEQRSLHSGDVIEFGFPDSYKLTFTFEEDQLGKLLDQFPTSSETIVGAPNNLAKLRALVEVARVLQSSVSTNDVLTAVVDAALAVTAAERGFLMLKHGDDLEISVARNLGGAPLSTTDLKVPMSVINRALSQRRELLSMSFDPIEEQGLRPDTSVANLELRSVVCVPLVRVRTGRAEDTAAVSSNADTIGVLYMDSRAGYADLSHGNRELLQTLALEASTILENARLLDEERAHQRIDEELEIARQIQTGLLPPELPSTGWFRAAGSSTPAHQVGGDYFDVRQIEHDVWSTVVADVSGKGVSSALLASLLQGAFLLGSATTAQIEATFLRINRYLNERTKGEKYATVFYSTLRRSGLLQWANAGQCAPILLKADGSMRKLSPTGLPLGMLEMATFQVETVQMDAGEKLVIYSDGVTESENAEGQFFGTERLRTLLRDHAAVSCTELHAVILAAVDQYTQGAPMADDITLVVVEFDSLVTVT